MGTYAFFDLEGTLATGNMWRLVARHPAIDAWRSRWAYLQGMPVWLARRSNIIDDMLFRDVWLRIMARLFIGWTDTQIRAVFRDIASKNGYYDDTVARLRQHIQQGDHVIVASGVFEEGAQEIAAYLGAHTGIGTKLEYQHGKCTGRLGSPTCGGERKIQFIRDYLTAQGLQADFSNCYAYADTLSDVPMLAAVGHPVATHPEAQLQTHAQTHQWEILAGAAHGN